VTLGEGVTTIGDGAFTWCDKLVEVVNKSTHITVTKGSGDNGYVGSNALDVYNSEDEFTSKLSNDNGYIVYNGGERKILLAYIGQETDLVLPAYTTEIYEDAFSDCSSLTSVVIPDSVTTIGDGAFWKCSSLTSVVIGDGVTTISDWAFWKCSSLMSVTIPDGVTSIAYSAFEDCTALTNVVIGIGVTSISEDAFGNCTNLTTVYYRGNASDWQNIEGYAQNTYITKATRYYYSETEKRGCWYYDADGNVALW
jgi:hypothetical protein